MGLLISIIIMVVLLGLGFFIGRSLELRHYQSIFQREKALAHIHLLLGKQAPAGCEQGALVIGSTVVSVDYFKNFLAALRNLFGGRVSAFETLLDRARREAILRMKMAAIRRGSNAIVNVRIETSSVSQNAQQQYGTVEVVAYGTAVSFDPAGQQ